MKFTKEMVDNYADKLLIGLTEEENKMVLDEFEIIDKNIDLILLDVNLPDYNGFDLFKDKGYLAKFIGDNLINLTITDDTKTEDIKFYNAEAISIEQPSVTIAKEEINTSLTIK